MKIKNKFLSIFLVVFMVLALFRTVQAITVKSHFTLRTGGTSAAMDSLDGATLSDGDENRIHLAGNLFEIWILDADSGLDENVSAGVVAPDTNPGSKRWIRYTFNTSTQKNALDYGNEFTDTTLQAAITDISTNHWSLLVNRGTWVIDADLTFAANTRLKFEEGAVFDINQSGTDPTDVVINGDLDAGMYQIFDVDANSSLSAPKVKTWYPEWFGVVGSATEPTSGTTYEVEMKRCYDSASNYSVIELTSSYYYLDKLTGGNECSCFRIDKPITLMSKVSSVLKRKVDAAGGGRVLYINDCYVLGIIR